MQLNESQYYLRRQHACLIRASSSSFASCKTEEMEQFEGVSGQATEADRCLCGVEKVSAEQLHSILTIRARKAIDNGTIEKLELSTVG